MFHVKHPLPAVRRCPGTTTRTRRMGNRVHLDSGSLKLAGSAPRALSGPLDPGIGSRLGWARPGARLSTSPSQIDHAHDTTAPTRCRRPPVGEIVPEPGIWAPSRATAVAQAERVRRLSKEAADVPRNIYQSGRCCGFPTRRGQRSSRAPTFSSITNDASPTTLVSTRRRLNHGQLLDRPAGRIAARRLAHAEPPTRSNERGPALCGHRRRRESPGHDQREGFPELGIPPRRSRPAHRPPRPGLAAPGAPPPPGSTPPRAGGRRATSRGPPAIRAPGRGRAPLHHFPGRETRSGVT